MTQHLPRLALAIAALLACAAPALAQIHRERPDEILIEAPLRPLLRAALLAHADSVRAAHPYEAADALHYAGESARRAGLADSALAAFASSVALKAAPREALAFADACIDRATPARLGDARRALESVLGGMQRGMPGRGALLLRVMWLQHLAGHADSARATLAEAAPEADPDAAWRLRMAEVAAAAGDADRALMLAMPVAIRSRGHDRAAMTAVERLLARAGGGASGALADLVAGAAGGRDAIEASAIERMEGGFMDFRGADGEPLGLAFFPTDSAARPRLALVVVAPGDSVTDHGHLVLGLRNAGLAVGLLWPRGHGRSAGPDCPSPAAWRGREDAMESRVADDMIAAAAMLTKRLRTKGGAWLAVGSRGTAGIAALAAERDRRAAGLLLASAEPPPVDRGVLRARVGRLACPLFLQIAPEDLVDLYYYSDALLQASRVRSSRMSESRQRGRGVAQFEHDPRSMRLLREWLAGALPAR